MHENDMRNVLALEPLERHALLSSRASRLKTFTSYLAMREKIAEDFLPLVASASPYINDHTRTHLERVLKHIEALLMRNFHKPGPVADIPEGRLLTWPDTLILLNALVWHDIGNIYGRTGHASKVKECFEKISGYLYDPHIAGYIKQVAEAHSGEKAIEKTIPAAHAAGSYQSEDIHLQFLAAILRFADELDEDHRRVTPQWSEMNLVPEGSRKYWFFSNVNSSIKVNLEAGEHNSQLSVAITSSIDGGDVDASFVDGNGSTRGLAEYFRRIFKIERERRYCNAYMRKAYYHPGVSSIRVSLALGATKLSPARFYHFELNDNIEPCDIMNDTNNVPLGEYIEEALK